MCGNRLATDEGAVPETAVKTGTVPHPGLVKETRRTERQPGPPSPAAPARTVGATVLMLRVASHDRRRSLLSQMAEKTA
jgi:hypothetical protein